MQEGRGHPSAQRVFRTSDSMGSPLAVFLVEELYLCPASINHTQVMVFRAPHLNSVPRPSHPTLISLTSTGFPLASHVFIPMLRFNLGLE